MPNYVFQVRTPQLVAFDMQESVKIGRFNLRHICLLSRRVQSCLFSFKNKVNSNQTKLYINNSQKTELTQYSQKNKLTQLNFEQ